MPVVPVAAPPVAAPPAPTPPVAAPLATLSALVAAATLLFIGLLGLIQVRRTMVPLERLIAGTRRLSEHDYSARVSLRPGDEFGELANSFNHMAERIDHQMQALRVQSSIDHEILNGLNVARVLQRVAHRLEQVVPGATACVVEFDRTSRLLARVHRAGTAMSIIGLPRADAISPWRRYLSRKPSCAMTPRDGCSASRRGHRTGGSVVPGPATSCWRCW